MNVVRSRILLIVTTVVLVVTAAGAVAADNSASPFVSPMFGDNMVLQRGKPNTIWGWAKAGQEIRITIASNTAKTVTKDDGLWSVEIMPPAPGGPYTITIDGPQHVEFHEVLVGDVWLCGGQSNMEFGLGRARNGAEEIKMAEHPEIRLFMVNKQIAYVRAGSNAARRLENLFAANHQC